MTELNLSSLEVGQLTHTLTEALIELGINAGERGEKYPLVLADLVPAIKKLKQSNEALHGEIKIMEAVQERLSDDLEEKFNQMQVSLIAFVMWKCGRKTLAIDSREITDTTRFGAQQIGVKAVDKFTTQYQVRPLKENRNGR
ncbi:hypothetical protein SOP91_00145 (plasmid) [Enterobacter hormaechei]|uniref:hypothetical protein n=1 Tax=Enterobacter hormaechei TaxID=158836 RepID=UPI002B4BEB06|nr:hypothetical protein [Enterobacter hormaechei]WRM07120.1 hypothetical protein SOP91_00145 [Enterobacter hormaechei]